MAGFIPYFDFDPLSSAEERHLYGEQGGRPEQKDTMFKRNEPFSFIDRAQSRVHFNIARQTIAAPSLSEVALLLGAIGSLVAIAFFIPRPQLQSHPRCGLTTGGQVSAMCI